MMIQTGPGSSGDAIYLKKKGNCSVMIRGPTRCSQESSEFRTLYGLLRFDQGLNSEKPMKVEELFHSTTLDT